MLASLSAALSCAPEALAPEALEPEALAPEEAVPDEAELPLLDDEPEADAVDEDDDAVVSPALSVVVCDAVSQAATKKATAKSAIRRCNMIMLPVFVPAYRNGLPTFLNLWRV